MLAILGGVGAAPAWGAATLCSSRSTRLIGPSPVLAWVMLVVAAFVAFRERLARHQVLGGAAILCGVAVLSVLQA